MSIQALVDERIRDRNAAAAVRLPTRVCSTSTAAAPIVN